MLNYFWVVTHSFGSTDAVINVIVVIAIVVSAVAVEV